MSMDNFNKKYEKKNPFSVPDGYFEQLEDRLMEQVGKREKHRKEGIWLLVKPYLGLTGVFYLLYLWYRLSYRLWLINTRWS